MKTAACFLASLCLAFAADPASVAGKWKVAANAPDGQTYQVALIIQNDTGKLSGKVVSERGEMPLEDVAVSGNDLTFKLVLNSGAIPFKLTVDGDTLKGTLATPDGSSGTVTGKREPAPAPASATGKWKVLSKDAEGNVLRATLELVQDGEALSGAITLENGDTAPISEGKATSFGFGFKIAAPEGDYVISGEVSGAELKGTYKSPNGSKGAFTGKK